MSNSGRLPDSETGGLPAGMTVPSVELLSASDPERWASVEAALDAFDYPYRADWRNLPPADDLLGRLEVMAHVKGVLPDNNPEIQKDTHNVTLENHVKLLLDAAGTQSNLETFLGIILARMSTDDSEQSEELARQAFLIYAPAAEVTGRSDLKKQLEEKAFEVLYPEEKARIAETYLEFGGRKALHTAEERYKGDIREAIETGLPDLVGRYGIETRRKGYYSVWRKCQLRGATDYQLPDFFGVRILVDSRPGEDWALGQCYAVADEVCGLYEPIWERRKDYIAQPKPNEYRSLHLTLEDDLGMQFEVQIRTTGMSEKLKRNPRTSHKLYDASRKITPGKYFQDGLDKPQRTYLWRDRAAELIRDRADGSLESLRPGKVLVFAYDGNLYEFSEGDTALDFSFKIHDERALRTERIFVNGKIASFEDVLHQGDWVNVQYRRKGPRQKTSSPGWLDMVNSQRAKRRIKRAEKESHAEEFIEAARREIAAIFPDIPNPMSHLTPKDERDLCKKYTVSSLDLVLREIGARTRRRESKKGEVRYKKVTSEMLAGQIRRRLEKQGLL